MRRLSALLYGMLAVLLATSPAAGQSDQVAVELEQFGVSNSFRPGDFTGIRVSLMSDLGDPMPVWVQVEVANADGDIGEYGRALTLTPTRPSSLWLYAPLPPEFDPRSVLFVRVFELEDGQRGGEIGGGRISPSDVGATRVSPMKAAIAVVSRSPMGLADYTYVGGMPDERPPFAHEDTRIAFGLTNDSLPDRWDGLRIFEAIVWGDVTPNQLTDAQVTALRHYVERGGQLVISLPAEGNPWSLGLPGQSRFEDLLPAEQPQKDEGVPLSTLLPALTKATDIQTEFDKSLWVFRQLGGALNRIEAPWQPLIALDDGRVFVVRRPYGFGFVTLLGLDLADRQLLSVRESVQADVFWNPILGRRIDTPSSETLRALSDARRLQTQANENSLGGGRLVGDLISMSEQAGRGLLMVFGVIVLYWLVAGPLGFYVLKHYRQDRHSWIAFAAAAGVFTAAAWGIVSVIKPATYRIQHVTFLDILGGDGARDTAAQRAATWFSLNMPGYRRTSVFIDSSPGQRDLLASWTAPEMPTQPFPNPDRFLVDVGNNPADEQHYADRNEGRPELRRPSRSTATQLYAHWMGDLGRSGWEGTIFQVRPVEVIVGEGGTERLTGQLGHDLPGELRDVQVLWVRSARLFPPRLASDGPWIRPLDSGRMLHQGGMWSQAAWAPADPLDLAVVTGESSRLFEQIDETFVAPYAKSTALRLAPGTGGLQPMDVANYLRMLGLFNQLTPPTYIMDSSAQTGQTVSFFRLIGRELDLSPWLTRPCLIVTARLDDTVDPVPLLVNGERPEHDEKSFTIVRWILPLELDERLAFPQVFDVASASEGATGPVAVSRGTGSPPRADR